MKQSLMISQTDISAAELRGILIAQQTPYVRMDCSLKTNESNA